MAWFAHILKNFKSLFSSCGVIWLHLQVPLAYLHRVNKACGGAFEIGVISIQILLLLQCCMCYSAVADEFVLLQCCHEFSCQQSDSCPNEYSPSASNSHVRCCCWPHFVDLGTHWSISCIIHYHARACCHVYIYVHVTNISIRKTKQVSNLKQWYAYSLPFSAYSYLYTYMHVNYEHNYATCSHSCSSFKNTLV